MSSAFVVGYTGETGKLLVRELLARKRFEKLVLIGRRPFDGELPPNAESRVVNFDELDKHSSDFSGFEQGFCCLGAWISTQGREAFVKIDRDATVKIAQLAKQGGAKHIHLITSQGASASSSYFYLRTKGEAEEGIVAQGFNRVSIYQPGFILSDRHQEAPGVGPIKPFFKFLNWVAPTLMTTKASDMARAMVARSMLPDSPEPEVTRLNIAAMLKYSKELDVDSTGASTSKK